MKKELKDYLHLYLGCEVEYQGANGRYKKVTNSSSSNDDYNFIAVLSEYNLNGDIKVETEFDGDIELSITDIKLILRPISDITEEEKENIEGTDWTNIVNGGWEYSPETFLFLLSQHFDLFNLHEAGLCLYKNDLKTIA